MDSSVHSRVMIGITPNDERVLPCLTKSQWDKIIDFGLMMEGGFHSLDAVSTVDSLRCYGLTQCEQQIIMHPAPDKEKVTELMYFLRMRPNLALKFIKVIFDQNHDNLGNAILTEFRRITLVKDEVRFRQSLSRHLTLFENLCTWGLPSLVEKGCISEEEYRKIKGSEDKNMSLLSILQKKSLKQYQAFVDLLIDVNMISVVSDLVNFAEHPHAANLAVMPIEDMVVCRRCKISANIVDKSSVQKYCSTVAVDCGEAKLKGSEIRRVHMDNVFDCNDLREEVKTVFSLNTNWLFLYQVHLIIREYSGDFRCSSEAFVDQVRGYTSNDEDTSPGDPMQVGILPMTTKLPDSFLRRGDDVDPILRLELDCEFWQLSNQAHHPFTRLNQNGDESLPFENRKFVAILRGQIEYPNSDSDDSYYLHFLRLHTNSFIQVSPGKRSNNTHRRKSTVIFIPESESLPKLRKAQNANVVMYIREGTNLIFDNNCIRRVSRDQGDGRMWMYSLKQTPIAEKFLKYLFS